MLITWMTPFEAITSGVVTRAPPTKTLPPVTRIATDFPLRVFAEASLTTLDAVALPLTTWYSRTGAQLRLVLPEPRERRLRHLGERR